MAYFAFALLLLGMRHFVLPAIGQHRPDIEQALSRAIALPVSIGAIEANWRGLWPTLHVHDLRILDAEGRPALAFDEVEADLAWASLWHRQPHFSRLEIGSPRLDLRRDANGRLFVAGLEMAGESDPDADFSDWLLRQDRIVIRDATVTWHDELRGAPPLALARLNLDLRNRGSRHRFGLTAEPPRELAERIDLRGDFRGRDLDALAAWSGDAYAELEQANLAGWQPWFDYPFELQRGTGGLRLWLSVASRTLTAVTADLQVSDASLRLAPQLPRLDARDIAGRLALRQSPDGFAVAARGLALTTHGGLLVEPTNLEIAWHPATGTQPARGEARGDHFDLGALAALAAYLPLDAGLHGQLAAYAPRGRIDDLRLSWRGTLEQPAGFTVKAQFAGLGWQAQGGLPGANGLSGQLEAREDGGSLALASRNAALELPAVFAPPRIPLASLNAHADWRRTDAGLVVQLHQASFQNDDAAGEASGRYRYGGQGPGEIDLTARLTRASGGAVWRYMPLVVNQQTRDWLRNSILGGRASATLRLKGDLWNFPFRDGTGIFEVKGSYQGAGLRYAADWPGFEEVAGELEFVGARMRIHARRAGLWGVQLADVKAEIEDLEKPDLVVTGQARGPTADFLRFVDASPLAERLEHFTSDLAATGNGELRLRLDLPLNDLDRSRVDGRYRLAGNGLTYHPAMPPLADINGELRLTGDLLETRNVRASMLGAPLTVDVNTEAGRVVVKAAGAMTAATLRQHFGHPLFEHLTGTAPWNASIRVKRQDAELRIESSLLGLSSSLPPPFNKTAGDALPLLIERLPAPEAAVAGRGRRDTPAPPAAHRDQLVASLGGALRLQLVRRHDQDATRIERGLLAIGHPEAELPARGVLLAVRAPSVDADFWRGLVAAGNGNGGDALPVSQLDVRTAQLTALGRQFHDLQLAGARGDDTWKLELRSRELAGRIEWNDRGAGRLLARLSRLEVAEGEGDGGAPPEPSAEPLPAIDLVAERFLLHGWDVGELRLKAENEGGVWNARLDAGSTDGRIEGRGRWQPAHAGRSGETAFDFKLDAGNLERLLGRFGHPGTVRRGTATLEGRLAWPGAPTAFAQDRLSGQLQLKAANGQFDKLEPGVGRLLGLVSLQSLPRRIRLDFRDVFSEGFAFDSLGGNISVAQGVLATEDFRLSGPTAKVAMHGTVNLGKETQDLRVRVQPSVGDTVATGVLLVNPAVGAAAWVANKVLGDPLDKAFAFEYAVSGSWAEPTVERVAILRPPGAEPASDRPGAGE
jgi:uncharacterized protein (TIGR02099 family)